MKDTPSHIKTLSTALTADGTLKLWSVIVTILGDLLQEPDATIPGPVLSALIAAMGLQPQAMRVALHRLKQDGWIESHREGRIGHYRLSKTGRAQTEAVRDRVYGPAPQAPAVWQLIILPPDATDPVTEVPEDLPYLPLTRHMALVAPGAANLPREWMVAQVGDMSVPDWAIRRISAEARVDDYRTLQRWLDAVAEKDQPGGVLTRAVLRLLVLHAWRRLVLRANPLAEALLGPTAPPALCRGSVAALLNAFPRPTITDLQMAVSDG